MRVTRVRQANKVDEIDWTAQSALRDMGPSLTVQSQREDTDINVLVRRFGVTGSMPMTQIPPAYGDFTGPDSYLEAVTRVKAAEAAFMELPATVRNRFNNDPNAMLQYLHDPARSRKDFQDLGFIPPDETAPVPAIEVPIVADAPIPPAPAPAAPVPAKAPLAAPKK